MHTRIRTTGIISGCGLLLLLLAASAAADLRAPRAASAAQSGNSNIQVDPQPDPADASAKGLKGIVMVSVLKDGAVVQQKELGLSDAPANFTVPAGVYDVRAEGDQMVTVLKRGIHATPNGSTNVIPPMRPGQGARVVEYATGGLAREEVAARLSKLEAAVAQLQKSQPMK